jgi:hypothetical protein
MVEVRAVAGPSIDGKAAWYGQFKLKGEVWRTVRNASGNAIVYTSKDYAMVAAWFMGKHPEHADFFETHVLRSERTVDDDEDDF